MRQDFGVGSDFTMANCANCGAAIERQNTSSRLVACPYCDTTQMFVDDAFQLAGQQGVMLDVPTLLVLGKPAMVERRRVIPRGHARFSYGRGWWDEFWCEADDEMLWISVDEGDVAIEGPLPKSQWPESFSPQLGAKVKIGGTEYTVTEAETAECVAVRGEFPEVISIGETHLYYDLSGENKEIVTLEQWEDESAWFRGKWIDPWKVKAADQ